MLKNELVPAITAIVDEYIKNVSFQKDHGRDIRVYLKTVSPDR